jgi:hypothetical protein
MRIYPVLLTLFAACVFLCGTAHAQKCTTDDTTVVATVAGTNDTSPANMITSDGLGPYKTLKSKGQTINIMFQICNGSYDLVMDMISSSRNLKVLLQGGTVTSSFLNFDRVASVPVTVDSNAFAAFCGGRGTDGSILLYTANTTTADNYGGCGQDALGLYFVRRALGMQLTNGHSLRYQNGTEGGTLGDGTDYIRVYHPTSTTWKLVPEDRPVPVNPLCGTVGYCAAQIYKPNNGPAYVQYYAPEKFVIDLTSSKIYPGVR